MKIAFLGDLAFFGKFSLQNNDSLYDYFKDISLYLAKFDLVVGNLETPFVTKAKSYGAKSAFIKSEPINVDLLKYLNINIVTIANNHTFDFGVEGFKETLQILSSNNIKYFGNEDTPLVIEKNGECIRFQGYCCYSSNPLGIKGKFDDIGINKLSYNSIEKFIKAGKDNELNIAAIHCGQEHINYPNYDHVKLSRQLSEVGPYVYYGHHPHVAQGVEKLNDSLIAHSLGNFCFDDVYTPKSDRPLIKLSENNKESFILEIETENSMLMSHKTTSIYMGENRMHINDEKTSSIDEKLLVYSDYLKKSEDIFTKERSELLGQYIKERKDLRNFKWYLKRLNLNSFFQLRNAYQNNKKYVKYVRNFLK